jgi:hypothetical protein
VPKNAPKVTWKVKVVDHEFVGRIPVIAKQLVGHVDNPSYPLIDVNIDMVLVTPANAKGPVPGLMMFGRPVLPAPAQPNPDALEKINEALRELLAKSDPSLQAILDQYPVYSPLAPAAAASPFGRLGASWNWWDCGCAGRAPCGRSSDDAAVACGWLGIRDHQSPQASKRTTKLASRAA